ncbi:MAG: sirohydrochlorin cobaltochelatase [Thermodesulfobacteriota bacterium]
MKESIPIVISAFGTTTKALKTYDRVDAFVRKRFPGHEIRWAYTSRIVKDRVKQSRNLHFPGPGEVLSALHDEGHTWAVVQSLHVLCGHEFDRLVEVAAAGPIRTAMGLPLLSAPEDFDEVVAVMAPELRPGEDGAVVLVGHGTDHPMWCAYDALEQRFQRAAGTGVHVGLVEGSPGPGVILGRVQAAGCSRVRLVPFMLVAGRHVLEDLAGPEHSWKAAFEALGIEVSLDEQGLGVRDGIIEIFCRHIAQVLDVIPPDREVKR